MVHFSPYYHLIRYGLYSVLVYRYQGQPLSILFTFTITTNENLVSMSSATQKWHFKSKKKHWNSLKLEPIQDIFWWFKVSEFESFNLHWFPFIKNWICKSSNCYLHNGTGENKNKRFENLKMKIKQQNWAFHDLVSVSVFSFSVSQTLTCYCYF